MTRRHDEGYKLLFSHPEMVRDLLRGFVHEPWVEELDFTTLEKEPCSFVGDRLRERRDDLIWRVRWQGNWLYVYILLEFQSKVDPYMALRMMSYVSSLWLDLHARRRLHPDGSLPPVLPVVLYNGRKHWTAPVEVADLVATMPVGLDRFRPRLTHLVIDELRCAESDLQPVRNLVAVLFQLEHGRDEDTLVQLMRNLLVWLHSDEQRSLRRSFAVWIRRVLLNTDVVGRVAVSQEIGELSEATVMLEENIRYIIARRKAEARAEGRTEALRATARRMQGLGVSVAEIAKFLGITEDAVRGLLES